MNLCRVRTYLIILLILCFCLSTVGGAQAGRSEADPTDGRSFESIAATEGTDSNFSDRHVPVIIVFENDSARKTASFSHPDIQVTGGSNVEFFPVLYATVPADAIKTLKRRVDVEQVFWDTSVSNPESELTSISIKTQPDNQLIPWGVDRIDALEANEAVKGSAKSNVTVAVVDTGVDYTHPDLDDTVTWGANFSDGIEEYGLSTATDGTGHGTGVAGIIAAEDNHRDVVGVAPGTELYAIRVLDDKGRGKVSWLISGIEAALAGEDQELGTADDADIISISLGGSEGTEGLQSVVDYARDHAVVVSGVGNDGDGDTSTNEILYPAKYSENIAVAATNRFDETPRFSAEGEEVELAAPGVDITTIYPGGITTVSGTSFATPHVSGVAALVIADDLSDGSRDLSPSAVRDQLQNATVDIEAKGIDRKSGYGLVLADQAINAKTTGTPEFAVADLAPHETTILKGEPVDISATVSNVGDSKGTQTVSLLIDEEIIVEKSLTLDASDSETIRFFGVLGDLSAGKYVYGIYSANDSQTATVTVQDPANFTISELSPENLSVMRGETLLVSAKVTNTGDIKGTQSIALWTKGNLMAEKSVTLASGETTTVEFENVSFNLKSGTHDISIHSANGSQTGEVTVVVPTVDIRELSTASVQPGNEMTITLETTAERTKLTFTELFKPGFKSATVNDVTVDGNPVSPLLGVAESEGAVVTLSGVPVGSTVTVQYTLSVKPNATAGSTYTITGELTNGKQFAIPSEQVTIEKSTLAGIAGVYDVDSDGVISIGELGTAAEDYAKGEISIGKLGTVATVYADS